MVVPMPKNVHIEEGTVKYLVLVIANQFLIIIQISCMSKVEVRPLDLLVLICEIGPTHILLWYIVGISFLFT